MKIDRSYFISTFNDIFNKNDLVGIITDEAVEKFLSLTELLLSENEKYNLTAIKEPERIILNHYADCAKLAEILPKHINIADVGCGAGFPTLPVAILRPDINVVGIDSTAKRTNFVSLAKDTLELKNVKAVTARAEDIGNNKDFRESFDTVVSRAVASLPTLTELCLPLVKLGGKFIAMKGPSANEELASSKCGIKILGGGNEGIVDVTLLSDNEQFSHPLVIIDKISKTPKDYPRAYAKILKKPL